MALAAAGLLAACAGWPGSDGGGFETAALESAPASTVPPLAARDIDGDGLISASEAAGYFARRFGALDQNGDAFLSRTEIEAELDGQRDPQAAFEMLDRDADRVISQDEYFHARSQRFRSRVEPATGMMSTSDFEDMIRYADPPLTDAIDDRPGA